jgi:hypothetical protein
MKSAQTLFTVILSGLVELLGQNERFRCVQEQIRHNSLSLSLRHLFRFPLDLRSAFRAEELWLVFRKAVIFLRWMVFVAWSFLAGHFAA